MQLQQVRVRWPVATADQLALSWSGDRGELGSADDRLCLAGPPCSAVSTVMHGEREDGQLAVNLLRAVDLDLAS
jgi:hypothetical protein